MTCCPKNRYSEIRAITSSAPILRTAYWCTIYRSRLIERWWTGFKGALGGPVLNTVLHRLSVLSKAHQLRDAPNPTRDPAVQEFVRRIRRAYAARQQGCAQEGSARGDAGDLY